MAKPAARILNFRLENTYKMDARDCKINKKV